MPGSPIYFDNNATTPLDRRAAEAMAEWLFERHGNASSAHRWGQDAREAVEQARSEVAALIGAQPEEVVFVASGTEANNTVLETTFGGARSGRLVTSTLEHPSIEVPSRQLEERRGVEVVRIAPDHEGRVSAAGFLAAVGEGASLAALMLASNELGTVQPVAAIATECRRRGVPVLCDAVQAVGKLPVDVSELDVDYLVVAAHKFHGPLGAAAVWVRPCSPFEPLLRGGAQERRRRAGTENVPALVGFGVASRRAREELAERHDKLTALRDHFERGIRELPGVALNCSGGDRLPNTSSVRFDGIDAHTLAVRLDLAGVAVSTGAACASGTVAPSRALLSLALTPEEALSTLRVSFGVTNTLDEVERALVLFERESSALRRRRPGAAGAAR